MSQHPKVDPLPSQKELRDIWTFENEEFKYTYGNTSGESTQLYGNHFYSPKVKGRDLKFNPKIQKYDRFVVCIGGEIQAENIIDLWCVAPG